jgi:hypothetical protein
MHKKDREREENQKLECGRCIHYIGTNGYSNLKLEQATMGRGLWSSEEVW